MIQLEQPKLGNTGPLTDRVAYLERYLYRLCGELQAALNALEQERNRKENSNGTEK